MNLASIVAAQGQYDVALRLYQQAEEESMEVSAQDRRLASSRDILDSGKDNLLYRRAIEYCFGNLNLAENKLEDAQASYRSCLDDYIEDSLEKNTHMTCGCHYKLSLMEMQLGDQERAVVGSGHLDDAMRMAQKANAQGYIGRILTLKLEFARKDESHQPDLGDPGEIQLRIKAVRSSLEAQSSGLEMPHSPDRIFEYFIPWQAR
ncbi:hypothetical protein LCI18_007725 [Fusarium solani-melongenae]|uniref:Uncharacterized protein n=1 Tax=Fusarium solani subsp. cucurbitae TaxID=2747967 RepID=A0ACD3Z6Q8_FUSSC|nr:hypothetical protein LCI18_007725 [Fusarium solani-melongenae]